MNPPSTLVASGYVAIGGGIGAVLRYQLGRGMTHWLGVQVVTTFPWATLAANVIGSMAMGLLAGFLARHGQGGEQWRLLLGVGLLGGFTTFSSFSLELMLLIERGQAMQGFAYAAISVLAGLRRSISALSPCGSPDDRSPGSGRSQEGQRRAGPGPPVHRRGGRRRHPARSLVQAPPAADQLRHGQQVGAHRADPRRRQARSSRRTESAPGKCCACRRAAMSTAATARSPPADRRADRPGRGDADRAHAFRAGAQQAARPRDAGRHQDPQPCRRPARSLCRRGRTAPAAGPPARQGYQRRPADRPHPGQRGLFLEALCRAARPRRSIGRWSSACRRSSRARSTRRSPSSRAPAARRCTSTWRTASRRKTKYRVVDRAGNRAAWLELEPLTGRTHQLRVHCAAMGHPIVGRRQVRRAGCLPDRLDQPQDAPPRPPPDHRLARWRQDRRDRRTARAFRRQHGAARLRPESQRRRRPVRDDPPPKTREEKKQAGRAHAKQVRKGRRGERTSRRTGGVAPKRPTKKPR